MTPEGLGRFFEEAFEKVVPRDDAHREKLAKLQAKMREIEAEGAKDLQQAMDEMAAQNRLSSERARQRAKESLDSWASFWNSFDEQTGLLERIVEATEKGQTSR